MTERGLFLDLDGTLADSLLPLKKTYFSFLDEMGVTGSEAEFRRLNGVPFAKLIETLKQAHGLPGDATALARRYSDLIAHAHASSPPAEGAKLLLKHARSHGWKVGVVTSSLRRPALDWLKVNGLLEQVDTVVGGDDVTRGKPAPEPYRLALEQTCCTAAGSLAVEDSRLGALSALSAGLVTWAIAPLDDRDDWPSQAKFIEHLSDLLDLLPTC